MNASRGSKPAVVVVLVLAVLLGGCRDRRLQVGDESQAAHEGCPAGQLYWEYHYGDLPRAVNHGSADGARAAATADGCSNVEMDERESLLYACCP